MTRTLRAIIACLSAQLFARGLDYATGNPQQGVGAFQVESMNPQLVWGVACMVAAGTVAAGLVGGWISIVRNGALLASAIYLSFSIMTIGEISWSPPDDWRFSTAYFASACMWSVISVSLSVRMAVEDHRRERDGRDTDH